MNTFFKSLLVTAIALSSCMALGASQTRTDVITNEDGGPVTLPAGATVSSTGTLTVSGALITTVPSSLTAAGAGTLYSGTSALTLTAGTNVAAVVTPVTLNMYRIGNMACAYGQVSIDPTSSATATDFTLTLPVTRAANFSGTAGASGMAGILVPGACLATTAAKTVTCNYVSGGTAVELVPVHFCHSVTGNGA